MPRKSKSKKASKQNKKWGSKSKESNSTSDHSAVSENHELIQQLMYGGEDLGMVVVTSEHHSLTPKPDHVAEYALNVEGDSESPECEHHSLTPKPDHVAEYALNVEGDSESPECEHHSLTPKPDHVAEYALNVEGDSESPESPQVPTELINIKSNIDDSDSDHYTDCEPEEYKLCLESGYGVPIVWSCGRGESGQQFRVDAAALAALVARAGAGRRVALVSVAGACRGGKSFLLGYMLRYLYALVQADEEPAGEEWLGGPEEPLRGFPWRGGCERETTGIVLWSQPFPVTLPDGEKVAVLLMDTQGSFDDQSSLRDCSLIFALSTLLASTQVYNISQQIKEDDLQHLQLFAEYAAAGGSGLAALQLLLRDWSAPYEHPYGAAGGASYLRDKLQVKKEQPQEARDLRQRLAGSFDDMGCFLMPHPGLRAATDPGFQGKLSELTEDFKRSLRELVPLLLAPARLRVKCVGGRAMAACELPVLLQTYLDEFSATVPSPRTVLSATARVAWLCGREAARARVSAAAPTRAVPRAELRARLTAAARDALLPLPPLADRAGNRNGLADFEKELDVLVDQYVKTNGDKIHLALVEASNVFESAVRHLEDIKLCVNPLDLTTMIDDAREDAVLYFDDEVGTDNEDPDRTQLTIDLKERSEVVLTKLSAVNAANNRSAVEAASAELERSLQNFANKCWPPDHLDTELKTIRERVLEIFYDSRKGPNKRKRDRFVQQIESKLSRRCDDTRETNRCENKTAVDDAFKRFCDTMDKFCAGFRIDDSDLERQLSGVFMERKAAFVKKRASLLHEDSYTNLLEQRTLERSEHYRQINSRKITGTELAVIGGAAVVSLVRPRYGLPALFTAVMAAFNKKPGSN